ncbi:hypothetical protein EfmAA818_19640 [Enterococcus faecium]|nr:hypothetical protein EfmAA818_19640 [Enterococcus faecium]
MKNREHARNVLCLCFFVINIKAAYGVVRIIESKKWAFPLSVLQETISEVISKKINNNLVTVLFTFKLGISLVKKTVCGMII